MTSFKNKNLACKDTLSTDFLLIWLFCGIFATFLAIFIEYPFISSILTLVALIVLFYEEPQRSIQLIQQLKATCFGILCGGGKEEATEESAVSKEEEDCQKPPPGKYRFAKLLLTNQVPLMSNYFEQKSRYVY
uniref:ATP synthase protein MI25 n=1 Tax=Panagrolaimus superbus TaxID=310955 RepID=A0A914YY86_9BILA